MKKTVMALLMAAMAISMTACGGQWMEGKRFGDGASEADVQAWIEGLDL